jgi:hypothetical protein
MTARMHPLFVELFIDPRDDLEETEDTRRARRDRARRARKQQMVRVQPASRRQR